MSIICCVIWCTTGTNIAVKVRFPPFFFSFQKNAHFMGQMLYQSISLSFWNTKIVKNEISETLSDLATMLSRI